jgi:glycosyltransferase involved in cell wall biosynthesis
MSYGQLNSPILSIIIPVYNTEKYIKCCIDSILSQKYKDYEILLIDDGSTDDSKNICDYFQAKDNRITVYHTDNHGVSAARNLGLSIARGKWIAFVDSDDWLCDNALDIINDVEDVDVILAPYQINYEGNPSAMTSEYKTQYIERKNFPILSDYLNTGIIKSVCSKFFKRDLIKNIEFDTKVKVGEDTLFTLRALKSAQRLLLTKAIVYTYRCFAPNSKYQQKISDSIYAMQKMMDAYRNLGIISYDFERTVFCDYKSFCQKDIYIHPRTWYKNRFVKELYKSIKKQLTYEYRLRYFISSLPIMPRIKSHKNLPK